MGGSFWIRIRLGKAVAGPGVRGQDDRDKWKQTSFFQGFRGGVWHPKCDHGRLVLDVRGQDDRDKWKQTFFLGIQRQRLAPKVQPWEAGFGPELDWEKLWRDQVSGAKMTETNRNKLVFF